MPQVSGEIFSGSTDHCNSTGQQLFFNRGGLKMYLRKILYSDVSIIRSFYGISILFRIRMRKI